MDPENTTEQAQARARQALQQGYRHFAAAWEQASAVGAALTHREQDLEAFRSVAAQATMIEPSSPAARVVVDQAGDIRRAMETHAASIEEVGAHVQAGVDAFSTGAAALGTMSDRAFDPQLREAAEQARSNVEFAAEVGRVAQESARTLAQPLRASSQMLAATAEATASTPGMPARALSAGRDAQEILGRARRRTHDLLETLDQLYQQRGTRSASCWRGIGRPANPHSSHSPARAGKGTADPQPPRGGRTHDRHPPIAAHRQM